MGIHVGDVMLRSVFVAVCATAICVSAIAQTPNRRFILPRAALTHPRDATSPFNPALRGVTVFSGAEHPMNTRMPLLQSGAIRSALLRNLATPKTGPQFQRIMSDNPNAQGPWTLTAQTPFIPGVAWLESGNQGGGLVVQTSSLSGGNSISMTTTTTDYRRQAITMQLVTEPGKLYLVDAKYFAWQSAGACQVTLGLVDSNTTAAGGCGIETQHAVFAYQAGAQPGMPEFYLTITPGQTLFFLSFSVSKLN